MSEKAYLPNHIVIDKSEENASLATQSQSNLWKKWQQHISTSQMGKKKPKVESNKCLVHYFAHTHTHTPDWGFVVSALHSKFKEGMAASLVAQIVKNLSAMRETQVQSLTWEDPLEKEMAIHSSILAWEIPWTEEPGELQVMELQS